MQGVRLLVGTRKGGFVLTSDETRGRWDVRGPLFGAEVYHMQGSSSDPDRVYAAICSSWSGVVIQRSGDGGRSWHPVGNEFAYADGSTTHQDFSGEQQPWKFRRVWHIEPAPDDWPVPGGGEAVVAGAEDAALFVSGDGGTSWTELSALRKHPSHLRWMPGAGGLCLHTILFDPMRPQRLYVAISAAGVFRSDDAGASWRPMNRGLSAKYLPEEQPEVGYCVHKVTMHPDRPNVLFMQKHYGVYRSDDAGESWRDVSGDLPSNFGFPIAVHPHEPDTVYVVPIASDEEHYPPEGALRVYRSRDGGGNWEPLTRGLPDQHCYVNVLRDAMATDRLDPCGVYFGTTGGQVYGSSDGGETWNLIVGYLPAVLSVEAQTLG
ncbi:MAG: exo-alpha-sialidase [Armatimonadota bacterium]|nr:exo-alpha-sialidase [Armatimonadota bacterium]MDR5697937.1 exo-alpha-sialidase [Armatimonadota bacterium]